MTDRVFYSTSEAVGAVCEALREYGTVEMEGRRVNFRQSWNNPDVVEFIGISERVPWSIVLNLSTLKRGDIEGIRARLSEQLKAQAGSEEALEQRL